VAPAANSAGWRCPLRERVLRELLFRSVVAASRCAIRRAGGVAARPAAGRRAIGIDPGVTEAAHLGWTVGFGVRLPHGAAWRGNRCCSHRSARGGTLGCHRAARAVRERLDAQGGNGQVDRRPRPPALLHAHRNLRPAIRENLGQRNRTPPEERTRCAHSARSARSKIRRIKLKLRFVADLAARIGSRRHGIIWQYLVACSASGIA
jgi:hypothetical protein